MNKQQVVQEIKKFHNGYRTKFTKLETVSLKDFEEALVESGLKLDADQTQEVSKAFLLGKYYE